MPMIDRKSVLKRDMLIAAVIVSAGAMISGVSIAQIVHQHDQVAQATPQPLQSTPGHENKPTEPASSTTGTSGARPHDISPQPARPDADAVNAGSKPALPAAPAEKVADPIPAK